MYQLMLAIFGRPAYLRLQELKCNKCNK